MRDFCCLVHCCFSTEKCYWELAVPVIYLRFTHVPQSSSTDTVISIGRCRAEMGPFFAAHFRLFFLSLSFSRNILFTFLLLVALIYLITRAHQNQPTRSWRNPAVIFLANERAHTRTAKPIQIKWWRRRRRSRAYTSVLTQTSEKRDRKQGKKENKERERERERRTFTLLGRWANRSTRRSIWNISTTGVRSCAALASISIFPFFLLSRFYRLPRSRRMDPSI